jgi:Flp pilus assembly protein TadB
MKLAFSLTGIQDRLRKFGDFLFTHNRMIYFVLFICVLIGAVLGLNLALSTPSDEDYRTERLKDIQSTRFDTDTIQKIQNLNARQQTNTDTLPTGQRINPFGE